MTLIPQMKLNNLYRISLLFLVILAACKTPEVPQANYYKPIFDQTNKQYARTPSNKVDLDTLVLIRSNLREVDEIFLDTLDITDRFILRGGELAVPVELINEKPPTYDTFLVAKDYRFTANYVNSVFPVIPPSVIEELSFSSDSIAYRDSIYQDSIQNSAIRIANELAKKDSIERASKAENKKVEKPNDIPKYVPSFLLSKSKRQALKSRKQIERNIELSKLKKEEPDTSQVEKISNELLSSEEEVGNMDLAIIEPELEIKEFYTKEEILDDSTRDLLDAESILDGLLNEAVWRVGDSIPFYQLKTNYFLDSSLVMYFDTVYVKVFDPSKVVPQLPYNKLVHEKIDTIYDSWRELINEVVTFKVYHPEMDDVYIPMVRVQGSDFKIGSNEFDEDERPAYNISVSSFLLGQYEVTNKLFCYLLNDMECDSAGYVGDIKVIDLKHPLTKIKLNKFTKRFETVDGYDDYPVVNVSWVGAQMFCKMAGGRLPSEAEWEFAARGGVYAHRVYSNLEKTDYDYVNRFAGGNYMGDLGWIVDNSRGQVWVGGKKLPNELGLYDMCGNVWEWCYDKYSKDFYSRNGHSRNPMCLDGGNNRVNRGGSWSSDAMYCRITNRNYLNQFEWNQYLGFRYMREWK